MDLRGNPLSRRTTHDDAKPYERSHNGRDAAGSTGEVKRE